MSSLALLFRVADRSCCTSDDVFVSDRRRPCVDVLPVYNTTTYSIVFCYAAAP